MNKEAIERRQMLVSGVAKLVERSLLKLMSYMSHSNVFVPVPLVVEQACVILNIIEYLSEIVYLLN